jgi:hypothetical protein
MKVESFYCEYKNELFDKVTACEAGLKHALQLLNENYSNGFVYKCNYDAFVNIKPGCWRKVIRFVLRKDEEDIITIRFKYGIFEEKSIQSTSFDFIEVHPVSVEHQLSVNADKSIRNPYLETGKIAVQQLIDKNKNIIPYCDLEVMVKVVPGCFRKIWNYICGNSYKNKFCFKYYEFNIAQKMKT